MNFYEFYQIINENTVSQEIKKLGKNEIFKPIIKTIFEEVKKLLFLGDSLSELNDDGKRVITNWMIFNVIKNYIIIKQDIEQSAAGHIIINRIKEIANNLALYIHYAYLSDNIDNQGNLNPQLLSKFNNPNFTLENLAQLDQQYHQNLKNKRKQGPGREGKSILTFNDGYKWVDLERGYCDIESETMGHCGNRGANTGDTILSLRDDKNRPHLTFILNDGNLGEMKGKGNDKPSSKYHHYIIELLKLPIIKSVKGGGYLPENNFKIEDLPENDRKMLFDLKPNFEFDYYLEKLEITDGNFEFPSEVLIKLKESIKNRNYTEHEINLIYKNCLKSKNTPENIVYEIIEEYLNYLKNQYEGMAFFEVLMFSVLEAIEKLKSKEYLSKLFYQFEKELSNIARSHKITSIYRALSSNSNLPKEFLIKLGNLESKGLPGGSVDANDTIVCNVASNPNTPIELLYKLSNTRFRKYVAKNTNVPIEILIKLSDDPKTEVRQSVARNSKTPLEILNKLSDDDKKSVRISATGTIRNPDRT